MARKILLADDSVTAQNMGRRILTDAGYDVLTVNNGSAALKKIAEIKPDLIVLDVYMPGYGGLEICQRLKENRETARIPVLLTVGKLEPFKAEEARRVRADSYIVKPFEASELLTALTKLEDKIVPQPEPTKKGRSARAVAAIDEQEPPEDSYGDKETGWKDRLKVPKPVKVVDREEEPARKRRKGEGKPQSTDVESSAPAAPPLPADITPEEIMAISAAAAVLNDKKAEPWPTGEPATRESSDTVTIQIPAQHAESAASVVSTEQTQETHRGDEQQEPVPQLTADASTLSESSAAAEIAAPTPSSDVVEVAHPVAAQAGHQETPDDDVMAALASLGSGAASGEPGQTTQSVVTYTYPRWIAEEITPEADEINFMLEREMYGTFAAIAAADHGRVSFESVAVAESTESTSAGLAEPLQNAKVSAESEKPLLTSAEEPSTAIEQSPQSSTTSASNNVVHTDDAQPKAPATVASDPVQTAAVQETPQASSANREHAQADPDSDQSSENKAAYAVAAAAGASFTAQSTPAESPQLSSAEAINHGNPAEAELAAAWANWSQVRESVIGSSPSETEQSTSSLSAAADQSTAQPKLEPAAPNAESAQSSQSETADPAELSTIVDTMLAELKPKLMEELARKLAASKKH